MCKRSLLAMEQCALRNVNNFLNTNIYSYLETSGGQSSNLYLNVVHFFITMLIRHLWQLETIVFLHWCLICTVPLNPINLVFKNYKILLYFYLNKCVFNLHQSSVQNLVQVVKFRSGNVQSCCLNKNQNSYWQVV